ncbi:unnamed protein product [Phytophthora fragariaefolia]|uniref:Unnamed protein product n=1 Tax=Phytophthora fragariaefolia TaxID=1490495 RepID=A0A9W6Y0C3_9STRA|nr:unnamed protein product [Phytophthora fragariaefolia]
MGGIGATSRKTLRFLNTGASVSMISLCLVRRLKLKLLIRDPIRVSGLGGVPTYISTIARIKIILGPRIVYVMSVYGADIGEGLEVMLGINFMYDAGVRGSVPEGLVQLPNEETVVILDKVRATLNSKLSGLVVEIVAKSWAAAVKVVNILPRMVWIYTGTAVAWIVEFGCFPSAGRWRESEPPCVQCPEYGWPINLMLRSRPTSSQVRIASLPGRPDAQDQLGDAKSVAHRPRSIALVVGDQVD